MINKESNVAKPDQAQEKVDQPKDVKDDVTKDENYEISKEKLDENKEEVEESEKKKSIKEVMAFHGNATK